MREARERKKFHSRGYKLCLPSERRPPGTVSLSRSLSKACVCRACVRVCAAGTMPSPFPRAVGSVLSLRVSLPVFSRSLSRRISSFIQCRLSSAAAPAASARSRAARRVWAMKRQERRAAEREEKKLPSSISDMNARKHVRRDRSNSPNAHDDSPLARYHPGQHEVVSYINREIPIRTDGSAKFGRVFPSVT